MGCKLTVIDVIWHWVLLVNRCDYRVCNDMKSEIAISKRKQSNIPLEKTDTRFDSHS